tara:strand:+ start:1235 stop:1837 length:603 start_codon:yes stop_codon:yes gene_type:complete
MFDKSQVAEEQLEFLEPYIEEYLNIANLITNVEDMKTNFIEKMEELHFKIVDEANTNIKNNKIKFGIKAVGVNPYSRVKIEKLPVPNLYSVLLFSNLWTSKIIGEYANNFLENFPNSCKNEKGEVDKDIAFNKIYAFVKSYADFYFSKRDGRKRLKEWGDYLKVPTGNSITVMATFYLFPKEFLIIIEGLYKAIEAEADK